MQAGITYNIVYYIVYYMLNPLFVLYGDIPFSWTENVIYNGRP